MSTPVVALATCSELPDLDPLEAPLIPALEARGVQARPAVWDDPAVDWSGFDLVIVRSTWDYTHRRDEFLEWADRVPRLLNPAPVLRWNTDKRYLAQLTDAGVPVVPTLWLEPERQFTSRLLHTRFPASGEFVIKPAVSAGSMDTGRYTSNDARSRGLAISHGLRLLNAGRTVMVQRYIPAVDTAGETALIYLDGVFSHAVRKGAMLRGPDDGAGELYRTEEMSPATATTDERAVADHVLAVAAEAMPHGEGIEPLLYARVDLVPDDDGAPLLLELELTEPSFFTELSDGALDRVADAIVGRLAV